MILESCSTVPTGHWVHLKNTFRKKSPTTWRKTECRAKLVVFVRVCINLTIGIKFSSRITRLLVASTFCGPAASAPLCCSALLRLGAKEVQAAAHPQREAGEESGD